MCYTGVSDVLVVGAIALVVPRVVVLKSRSQRQASQMYTHRMVGVFRNDTD